MVIIDTLHPVHEGHVFRFGHDPSELPSQGYGRTGANVKAAGGIQQSGVGDVWRKSVFFHMLQTGDSLLRRRLTAEGETEFNSLPATRAAGMLDYVAIVNRFSQDRVIGEMDCVYSAWSTLAAEGFSEADVAALRRLVPALGLAIKSAALAKVAATLVEVYLGRDAGRRVLEGRIQRGVADRIEAALWFSDLRSFTTITDTASPGEIIPLLNDYAEAVITAIHEAGGDVLKLIGDGILALFRADDPSEACRRALQAEEILRTRVKELNEKRRAEERPVTSVYIGLHIGEVFYGNIGSVDRLDFTVVGPAVNETSRIASMCRSVDRPVLISSTFADCLTDTERARLVSVGRFALRGVGQAKELFTLDPQTL
jgi:adenylate cyclase